MPKQLKRLTEMAIKNLRLEEGKRFQRLYDGGGLFIYLMRRGNRVWKLRYHDVTGKERWMKLGEHPAMSIKEARLQAAEIRNKLTQGIDPKREREERRAQGTFESIATRWLHHAGSNWTEKTRVIAATWLASDVFPVIGPLPIGDVEAPDILRILRKVDAAGHGYKVRRLNSYIKRIFSFAISHGEASSNPASELVLRDLFSNPKRRKRPAYTEPKDVGRLLRMIDGYEGSPVTRCGLQLLALVFCRPGELTTMRWAEIDFERRQWRYHVTKVGVDHIVPLSRQALAILEELRPLTGRWDYVFPGERSKARPMSNNTLNAALRYLGIDTAREHCAHGFRATARTLLAEKGWRKDYIELQLSHRERDQTVAAYAREKHLRERTEMMQDWADYLDALRHGAAVIPIHRKQA